MLTPSSNTALEPLTAALLARTPHVTAHFARLRVTEIALSAAALGQFDHAPQLAAADLLADAKVHAIAWNGTAGGWRGFDADRALCAAITARTGAPATISTLATLDALAALEARRIAFVTLALGGVAQAMTAWVASLGLTATGLLLALIVFYVALGMFMDVLSMQVLTIPVALPIVTAVGIDPIWFGIFIVLMCELGMITPPVGMNLYVVQGVRGDGGPFRDVVRGAIPYVVIMLLFTLLIIAFPQIVLWLPDGMYGA